MRYTLTSGEWIDVLPIGGLRAKHKDAVESAIKLHVQFNSKGEPDLSNMPLTMTIPKAQQHVLMAMAISGWSFAWSEVDYETGNVEDSESGPLPKPEFHADGAEGSIENEFAFGEIEIDDWLELEEFFAPYMEKVRRRPDPKGTITEGSNGTSLAKAGAFPKV